MAELGLNANHEEQIVSFLDFSRGKKAQCLKDVGSAFSELAESRLIDDTFTSDEVKEMLDGLCAVLKADVGSDLLHTSHTSALLLRQLFQQAEQWHLKLKVDLSEMQSGELLAKIADFEQKELSSVTGSFHKHRQLDPINTTGGEKLLQMEIDRVQNENSKLQSRIQELEEKATHALKAKDKLQQDLHLQQNSPTHTEEVDTSHWHQQIAELKLQLSEAKKCSKQPSSEPDSRKELETTSHELLKVSAELEEAKKDLQRKFSETTQYNNMRKMMESKTATIQALRSQLKQMEEKES